MSETSSNGGRVTTREFYNALLDMNKNIANMEIRLIDEIGNVKTSAAVDRTAVKSLLRRDTIGYVWDSINTLVGGTIILILYKLGF